MSEQISIFKNEKMETEYIAAYDEALKLWPVPFKSTHVPTKFGETHVVISGPENAKPIFLLHGAAASATMWYANVGELSTHYRTYAVDTIGDWGKSRVSLFPKNRQELAEWLHELSAGLGLEKPHMIGMSFGGFLTMNFAYYYPESVDKIGMLAPAAVFKKLRAMFWIQAFSAMLFPTQGRREGFRRWLTADGNVIVNAYTDQFKMAMGQGRTKLSVMPSVFSDEELKSIKNPALLLIGDQEVIYDGPSAMERAKQLMPQIQTRFVPNCGHGMTSEQSEFVNKQILGFLSETSS